MGGYPIFNSETIICALLNKDILPLLVSFQHTNIHDLASAVLLGCLPLSRPFCFSLAHCFDQG